MHTQTIHIPFRLHEPKTKIEIAHFTRPINDKKRRQTHSCTYMTSVEVIDRYI